jgi:signal transduction histidine kinase
MEALKRAVGGLRDAIYDLRLDSIREQSLVRSLESIVELNRRMGGGRTFDLVVAQDFPDDLSAAAGIEVMRVVQEALANVRRHSGARRATVTLGLEEDEVRVEIEDDGRGFGPETSPGIGLTGMRERVHGLGGRLEVGARRAWAPGCACGSRCPRWQPGTPKNSRTPEPAAAGRNRLLQNWYIFPGRTICSLGRPRGER